CSRKKKDRTRGSRSPVLFFSRGSHTEAPTGFLPARVCRVGTAHQRAPLVGRAHPTNPSNPTAIPSVRPFWLLRTLRGRYFFFSYTILPPTTVIKTSVWAIRSASALAKISRERTTRSASFPGSSEPLFFS